MKLCNLSSALVYSSSTNRVRSKSKRMCSTISFKMSIG
ncbi:hypothetical protein CUS_4265 [Ruminococcus albus 8]|uniref:Uncharacterized protein n=1 Tax=Ruminococcus albus 8 TaxID=246199 RepID=E9SEJ4_RUMAL|nr:hypothetical protein CUS_4265 [Ruminococcus albus 8]